MKLAYQILLHLYPAAHRTLFGQEMASVFDDVTADYRSRGMLHYAAFLATEFGGLIIGAFAAWSDEYMRRAAPRRWMSSGTLIPAVAGLVIAAFLENFFIAGIAKPHVHTVHAAAESTQWSLPLSGLLALIGLCLVFISVMAMAFVWNMRVLGNRAGRLNPIWMPGRTTARTRQRLNSRASDGTRRGRP